MIAFKDSLPASYEVTFLPLLVVYVFFAMGMSLSVYIAIIAPVCYCTMCLFFIVADLLDGIAVNVLIAKVLFVVIVLSPALTITLWRTNLV